MEIFFQFETYVALLTLTIIEIILGIDNIIFISIITNKVEEKSRQKARVIGLLLALILRIIMLFGLTWFIGLTEPIFIGISIKDIILFLGGGFLIFKSVLEISRQHMYAFDVVFRKLVNCICLHMFSESLVHIVGVAHFLQNTL